jgi:hypothetical protein
MKFMYHALLKISVVLFALAIVLTAPAAMAETGSKVQFQAAVKDYAKAKRRTYKAFASSKPRKAGENWYWGVVYNAASSEIAVDQAIKECSVFIKGINCTPYAIGDSYVDGFSDDQITSVTVRYGGDSAYIHPQSRSLGITRATAVQAKVGGKKKEPVAATAAVLAPGGSQRAVAGPIGSVDLVSIWAYGKVPAASDWGDMYVSDDVVTNHGLRTPSGGALHVSFLDSTILRLGSNAEIVVDRFVYNPSTRIGELSAEIAKGAFRFVTGRMRKDGFRVGTPSAVIAVRGTDFIVAVAGNGATTVQVFSGEVEITPRGGGASVSVPAGQIAAVSAGSQSVDVGVAPPASDPGLDEDGGGSGGSGGGGGDDSGGGGHG